MFLRILSTKNQLQIDPETTIKASLLGIKAIEFVLEDLAKNTELYSSQDFYLTKSINSRSMDRKTPKTKHTMERYDIF